MSGPDDAGAARRDAPPPGRDFDPDALDDFYQRAREAEDAGDVARASALFQECLAMDPEDHCGVVLRLAALGVGAPDRAPPAYVATLFEQHAEVFDEILVRRLGYDVPALTRRLVDGVAAPKRLLDLGCGTGLVGAAFAGLSEEIVGVDLAEGMLALADDRGVYTDLYMGEAVEFLREWDEAPFDLVVAADVWPYLGDLAPFARAAAGVLAPEGLLAASTERAKSRWHVTQTQRFAHSVAYVEETLAAAGQTLLARQAITVRHEEGAPVEGDLFLARRAA